MMQYQPKHYKWILYFVILLMALSMAVPVLADYLGPNRTVTTTVSVCKVVLKSCMYVESKGEYRYHVTDSWSCSNESKPWQAYPSNGGACPPGKDHWERDESVQEITVTYDPATIVGSVQNCTLYNGWCNGSMIPQLALSANEPLAGYNITLIEGRLNNVPFACQPSETSCTLQLNQGDNNFNYWALSSWGDSSTMGTSAARVDTVAPNVGLDIRGVSGANGWYVSPITITATGADATSGVASMLLSIDGGATWQPALTLNEGVYNAAVSVVDNAGNVSNSSATLSVDTTTPSITMSVAGTLGKNGWYKSAIQVSAQASDATSGVASFEVSADGAAFQTYTPISFNDGPHTVRFKAVDAAGNVTETALQTFYVDTLAPTVNLPASWKLGTNVPYDVIDEGSGLGALRIVIEDEDEKYAKVAWNQEVSGSMYSQDIDWNGQFKDKTVAPPGTYLVWIKASDLAGNERFQLGKVIVPETNLFLSLLPTEAPAVAASPVPPAELSETDSVADSRTGSDSVAGFGGETTQPGEVTTQSVLLATGSAGAAKSSASSSVVLWGTMAAAAISAATAYALEADRKRKEAEAAQAAQVRAEVARGKEKRAEKQQKQQENYNKQQTLAQAILAYQQKEQQKKEQQAASNAHIEKKMAQLEANWVAPQVASKKKDEEKKKAEAKKAAEMQAKLANYSAEKQEAPSAPTNWWEATKSFVKDKIIDPVNASVVQPVVKPFVQKTVQDAKNAVALVNEKVVQPYVKPYVEKEIEKAKNALTWVNEKVVQPYVKPHIEAEIQKAKKAIELVNEKIYQPYIKPHIEAEIQQAKKAIEFVNEKVIQPYVKPYVEAEIQKAKKLVEAVNEKVVQPYIVPAVTAINEKFYQPYVKPLVDKTKDALTTAMQWVNEEIYQPVFAPVVNDINKYIYQPLAQKASDAWEKYGEWVHGSLDAAGFIPGFGEIADGLNGLIYLGEGRYIEATVSALAMIPILGDLGKAGKWGLKLGKEVAEEVVEKVVKEVMEEAAEKIAKEATEEVVEKVAKETVEEVAEKTLKETGEELAEKAARETLEEVTEKVAKEAGEELASKAAKEAVEVAVEKTSKDAAEKIAKKVTDEVVEKSGKDAVAATVAVAGKDASKTVVTTIVTGTAKSVSKDTVDRALKEAVEGQVTKLPKEVAESLTKDSAKELAEKMSQELGGKRVWVSSKTGSVYISTPPANWKALAAQLDTAVKSGDKDAVRSALRQIAEQTSRGSGKHVILGPFKPDGAFIQEALDTDGIFWDVGDELWEAMKDTGIDMFEPNSAFLRLQVARGVDSFDVMTGTNVSKVIDDFNSGPISPWDEILYREKEVLDLASMPDIPYQLDGNSFKLIK